MITASQQGQITSDTRLVRRSEIFFRGVLWLLIAYSFAVWAIALVDWFRHPSALSPYFAFGGSPVFRAFANFVGAPVIVICSGLILKKQKQNIVGLLLLAWGAGFASFGISVEIEPALYLLVSLPVGAWWLTIIVSPYYFPDGHAYPHWLSPFLPGVMVLALVWGFANTIANPVLDIGQNPSNPFYIPGIGPLNQVLGTIYLTLNLVLVFGVIISPLLRYRRADIVQRQQIKWFVYWSMMVFAPYLVFYLALSFVFFQMDLVVPPVFQFILEGLIGIIGLFPPIIIAVAILRHRLYDIDIVIRRTLVYTILTASLGLVYFGMVVLLQAVVGRSAEEQSPLVIVFSTLLIAALFSPLRLRIQAFIDRRFFRRKYDAALTLAQFAQTARDEVDIEMLTAEINTVLQNTIQPSNISFWVLETKKVRK